MLFLDKKKNKSKEGLKMKANSKLSDGKICKTARKLPGPGLGWKFFASFNHSEKITPGKANTETFETCENEYEFLLGVSHTTAGKRREVEVKYRYELYLVTI